MAIDFSALKAKRGQNVASIQKSLEKTEGNSYEDARIWKPTKSDKNISMNVIRLLPIPKVDLEAMEAGKWPADTVPTSMQKVLRHNFKGPKGYLNAISPQTLSQPDPISEWSRPQWASIKDKNKDDPLIKAERERLKDFIPKSEYYTNIKIISDTQKPEFNGKVMLYKYGESMRKFIDTAAEPKFPTDPKFDPFCPWEGANIQLNLSYEEKTFGGKKNWVPKFESVKWDAPSVLGTEEEIEEIWGQQYSLLEFIDPAKVPSYDELAAKFQKVMGMDANFMPVAPGSTIGKTAGAFLESKPASASAAPEPTASAPVTAATAQPTATGSADAADDLEALEALLRG